ncbi:predicted protein [Naegleria gruberi]|uniref:Predicted protein n=1 Tax=Naegleria gruberi TaxID=5762 RepID=D2UZJ1_NAEGR|nr:uncharacterized protein NAEGRDRAFT_61956 [Naegleria gruberi]EFC50161.1 predicted protein [Naegleria gruberi]|eukprot:XP_002682905.1 predicted protein [Naegleria gruberi strain NEG-M]
MKQDPETSSADRKILPNPINYQSSSRANNSKFKLSKFSQFYSFFQKPETEVKLNFLSKFIYQRKFTTRALLISAVSTIGFIGFSFLPSSSFDETVQYWTNIPAINMTNIFKSRLYHKKETCFIYRFEAPYPYATEYDLTQEESNMRMFFNEEYLKYWDDLTTDLNVNNNDKDLLVHPLDLHIFSIRKGKPVDLEYLWYLYLQLHSIKYDSISDLIKSNRVSNDLLYDLKIASNFDHEHRYFTQNYIVNANTENRMSLNERIQNNIRHQNSISTMDSRKVNEEYQERLKSKKDILTPQDYQRLFYTENRKYRFSSLYHRNFVDAQF